MQRAYDTVFLVGSLERAIPLASGHGFAAAAELPLARDLALVLTAASYTAADAPVSCVHSVRAVVLNIVELFGPSVGDVQIRTDIEAVTLPAFKARALLLLAHHLVVNALRHGLRAAQGGQISVTLRRVRGTAASLVVADTGSGVFDKRPGPPRLTWDLASLLEVEPTFYAGYGGGLTIKVEFPT
jgi:two-component sensor histidine kinase